MSSQSETEFVSHCKEVFDLFNIEENGISSDNLVRAIRSLGYIPTDTELNQINFDLKYNSDGKIDFDTFLLVIKNQTDKAIRFEQVLNAFKFFDKNQTGLVETKTLRHILSTFGQQLTQDEIDNLFDSIQIKNDANVNYVQMLETFFK